MGRVECIAHDEPIGLLMGQHGIGKVHAHGFGWRGGGRCGSRDGRRTRLGDGLGFFLRSRNGYWNRQPNMDAHFFQHGALAGI